MGVDDADITCWYDGDNEIGGEELIMAKDLSSGMSGSKVSVVKTKPAIEPAA